MTHRAVVLFAALLTQTACDESGRDPLAAAADPVAAGKADDASTSAGVTFERAGEPIVVEVPSSHDIEVLRYAEGDTATIRTTELRLQAEDGLIRIRDLFDEDDPVHHGFQLAYIAAEDTQWQILEPSQGGFFIEAVVRTQYGDLELLDGTVLRGGAEDPTQVETYDVPRIEIETQGEVVGYQILPVVVVGDRPNVSSRTDIDFEYAGGD